MITGDRQLMDGLKEDYRRLDLSPRHQRILDYAMKLTDDPATAEERDIEGLREVGLGDRDVFDLVQVVAYFNYINRVADGLGVQLEPGFPV